MTEEREAFSQVVAEARKRVIARFEQDGLNINLLTETEKAAFELGLSSGVTSAIDYFLEMTS